MRLSANRFGWLALPLFCLILGYLLVWQRGLYNDDYSHYERFRNASSTLAALTYNPDFPVRALFWPVSGGLDALALSHGLLVRFVLAAGAGLNALLLGWLVYRLLRSRLAAIVAGWLFLMPFFSWDVVLWTTSANHLFGPTFGLLFLHACLSALQNERLSWRSIVVCSACLMASMLFVETSLAVAAIVPLLALCVPLAERPGARLFALKRSFLIIGIPLAVAALFVLLFYTGGSQVLAGRSAIDASIGGIMQRLPQYANRLRLLTVSGQFGRQVVKDALELGRSALGDSPLGLALAAGAILALVAQIAAWRREPGRAPATRAGLLLGAGVAWFGFVLLFPAILVKQQFLEYKFLYFSGAGLCVAAGAAACILAQVLRQVWWERFVLAATGMVVIVASVGLLGFASAFDERYR